MKRCRKQSKKLKKSQNERVARDAREPDTDLKRDALHLFRKKQGKRDLQNEYARKWNCAERKRRKKTKKSKKRKGKYAEPEGTCGGAYRAETPAIKENERSAKYPKVSD